MATSTETAVYTAEWLVRDEPEISRETGTVLSGETLVAGEVVEKNGDGKWIACTGTLNSDGNGEFDIGVSYRDVDASAGDVEGAVIVTCWAAAVAAKLTYPDSGSDAAEVAAINAALRDRMIRTL